VVITAASADIADKFDKKDLVGSFLLSLWAFSALLKWLNCTYWIKWTHTFRFNLTNILFILGFMLMSYTYLIDGSEVYGFYLALFATLIIGIASAFGESVNLGFLRGFPPDYVSGFSAGTGLAGIYGTGYYILMK